MDCLSAGAYPFGDAACSEGLQEGIKFSIHTQNVKIDSLLMAVMSLLFLSLRWLIFVGLNV